MQTALTKKRREFANGKRGTVQYFVAEKFKSIQGEGLYAGTPMAFIRFVGCSVGKKICNACDTDFETMHNWRGGGAFSEMDLLIWASTPKRYGHICLTGGEPLDQDLLPLFSKKEWADMFHIETSGTKPLPPEWASPMTERTWLCVSPKPGFREDVVLFADEIKVIVPGLGSGPGWPTIDDAKRWADRGKIVYLQPRNARFDVDQHNLRIVEDIIAVNPQFRLSVQMHKILKVQ